MDTVRKLLKLVVAAVWLAWPAHAQSPVLDDLFTALKATDAAGAQEISRRIWEEWSKSGSPAMDLLLQRGRAAMAAGDNETAIGHFNAIIDHAPEFAEAYNARATAYYNMGRLGQSLEDVRVVLALNPRHFGALSGLGLIMNELGHHDFALRAYQAIEDIYPTQPNLRENIERLEQALEGESL